MYRKTKLANGVTLVTHRMPLMQSVTLGLWMRVGSRLETLQQKGISHFLEHMLFKGTPRYSCRRIKEEIEGIGGNLNGFTSEENTCYLAKVPAKYLRLAFRILSDMMLHPLLKPSDIEKEKTVILEEIKMYEDLPQSHVYELLDELLWPDQPLGCPIIGRKSTVGSISRKDLAAYRNQHYSSSHLVIAAAGNLEHEMLLELSRQAFSGLKKSEKATFFSAIESQDMPQVKFLHKKTAQTHMAIGFHGFKRGHPLHHAVSLLHIILGANMSSRLFEEVRERRGLAYEIGTQVKRYADTGAFLVHAGTDNKKTAQALSLILKELELVREKPVTADELKRAKDYYVGQLRLALEDTMDHMLWIGDSTVALDKTYSLQEINREVEKIGRHHIKEAAEYLFKKDKINLALIGELKPYEKEIHKRIGS